MAGRVDRSWRNGKHRQQWRNTLAAYVYPVVGELPVADIATAHVLKILEPIWQATGFRVRCLVLKPAYINLAESVLIMAFRPPWNGMGLGIQFFW